SRPRSHAHQRAPDRWRDPRLRGRPGNPQPRLPRPVRQCLRAAHACWSWRAVHIVVLVARKDGPLPDTGSIPRRPGSAAPRDNTTRQGPTAEGSRDVITPLVIGAGFGLGLWALVVWAIPPR